MSPFDESRNEFIDAFKEYAREGNAMRDLLLRDSTKDAVAEQQIKLNASRDRYQSARERYVRQIMQGLGDSRGEVEPHMQIRTRRPDIH